MGATIYTKGAAEIMLGLCTNVLREDGSSAALEDEEKQRLLHAFERDGRR